MEVTVDKDDCNGPIAPGRECFLHEELAGHLYILPVFEDDLRNPVLFDIVAARLN